MSGHHEIFPGRQDTGVDELSVEKMAGDTPLMELDPNTPFTSTGLTVSPTGLISSHPISMESSYCRTVPNTSKDSEYDVSTGEINLGSTYKSEGTTATFETATDLEPDPMEPAKDISEPCFAAPCTCAACLSCICWKKCKKLLEKKKEQAEKNKQKEKQPREEKL